MEEDQEFEHIKLDTFQLSMKIPFICELIYTTCFSMATMFFVWLSFGLCNTEF